MTPRRPPGFVRAVALCAAACLALTAASGGEAATKKKGKKSSSTKKGSPPPSVPRPADPARVTFASSDGVQLAATWKEVAGQPGAPAVLVLHDFSRERREWAPFTDELNARGLATLALDLRGHGESTRKAGGAVVNPSPKMLRDPNGFPRDVAAACAWLRARGVKVGVLGVSAGANLAVIAAARGQADAAVAVSANAEPLVELAGGIAPAPRATLVLASADDPGREASARAIDASGSEPKKLVVYPGAAHNLVLLRDRPEAWKSAIEWLEKRLGAVAPQTVGPGPAGGSVLVPGPTPPPDPSPPPASPHPQAPAPGLVRPAPTPGTGAGRG